MPTNRPNEQEQTPSTSTAQSNWKSTLVLQDTDRKLAKIRQKIEEIRVSCRELFKQLRNRKDNLLQSEPIQRRLSNWREGWLRVLAIYPREGEPQSLEWKILRLSYFASMSIGILWGGLGTIPESSRRFDVYTVDKNYGSVFVYNQRRISYILTRFYMKGIFKGISTTLAIGAILSMTVGVTAYRDRYSLLHFPIPAFSVLTFCAFWRGLGIFGLYGAIFATMVPSFLLTVVTLGCCLCAGTTVDEGYKRLRVLYREQMLKEMEERTELNRYLNSHNIAFTPLPIVKRKLAKERELGTWRGGAPKGTSKEEWETEDNELVKFAEQGDSQ